MGVAIGLWLALAATHNSLHFFGFNRLTLNFLLKFIGIWKEKKEFSNCFFFKNRGVSPPYSLGLGEMGKEKAFTGRLLFRFFQCESLPIYTAEKMSYWEARVKPSIAAVFDLAVLVVLKRGDETHDSVAAPWNVELGKFYSDKHRTSNRRRSPRLAVSRFLLKVGKGSRQSRSVSLRKRLAQMISEEQEVGIHFSFSSIYISNLNYH